jgi:hypothetical protein
MDARREAPRQTSSPFGPYVITSQLIVLAALFVLATYIISELVS